MWKPKYDYAGDILNRKFDKLAELIRNGDVSALDSKARNLLADYLEGKLVRGKGRPQGDDYEKAESLHGEYIWFRNYGIPRSQYHEELRKIRETSSVDNYMQNVADFDAQCAANRMNREKAINAVAEQMIMGVKNVERLIDSWSNYLRQNEDYFQENYDS